MTEMISTLQKTLRHPRTRVVMGIVCGGILLAPVIHWHLKAPRRLNVFILDKTVPEPSRREHAGLVWLLNHRKILKPGGQNYRTDQDYYGFFPKPDHQWEAREGNIAARKPELIYLADAYGVYSEEFFGTALGNRSRKLYGGLRSDEANDIEAALPGCLTLVGEFNMFANPTEGKARSACQSWFGLTWKGWIGRFFRDLDRRGEMPPWAVRNYRIQTGKEWTFEGPGFLLVNEDDRVEVLEEGKDVKAGSGLRMHGRPDGIKKYDLPRDTRFDYWFDLVQPRPGTEVLADFELPLLPEGERRLKALGIPSRTPAVLASWRGGTHSFYLAGDFVDSWPAPYFYQVSGLAPFRRAIVREAPGDPQSFFWTAYIPMMTKVLEETWARKNQH
jgi:hypothetical protein